MKVTTELYRDASWLVRVYSVGPARILVNFIRRGPSGTKMLDRIGVWERTGGWLKPPTRPWYPQAPQVPDPVRLAVERKLREVVP